MKYLFRRIITIIVLITFITSIAIYAYAEDLNNTVSGGKLASGSEFTVSSPSAILIDAKTGNILFEKSSNANMYPASITKILTAALALEKGDLNSVVKMSHKAIYDIEPGSSNAGFLEDEELTLEQQLYALLLWSANESANAIAEHIGGTRDNFINMMNLKAAELGCQNTHFANPNGLHSPNHYTSAHDMALIAKYAMSNPKFREIVKTINYVIPPTNKMPKEKELHTKNQLLLSNTRYYYKDAIGIKTGYTSAAGSTLVSAASRDNIELISVVMNSPIEGYNSYMYIDSIKMFNYGFDNFYSKKVLNKDEIVSALRVKGSNKKIKAVAAEDAYVLLSKNEGTANVKTSKQFNIINAPVKKGDIVGTISFKANNKDLGKVNLVAYNDAPKALPGFLSIPKEKTIITMLWFIIKWIIFLIIVFILFIMTLFALFWIYARVYKFYKKYKKRNKYKLK